MVWHTHQHCCQCLLKPHRKSHAVTTLIFHSFAHTVRQRATAALTLRFQADAMYSFVVRSPSLAMPATTGSSGKALPYPCMAMIDTQNGLWSPVSVLSPAPERGGGALRCSHQRAYVPRMTHLIYPSLPCLPRLGDGRMATALQKGSTSCGAKRFLPLLPFSHYRYRTQHTARSTQHAALNAAPSVNHRNSQHGSVPSPMLLLNRKKKKIPLF